MKGVSITAAKVGALAAIAAGLIFFMSVKLSKGPGVIGAQDKFHFIVADATGIIKNGAVKMAGVKVGIVEDIVLKEGKAMVTIIVKKKLGLTEKSYVEMKADGLLGDKHVALYIGDSTAPLLPKKGFINSVKGNAGMNEVMSEVASVAHSLKEVAEALKSAAVDGDNSTPIGRIIGNIEVLTEDLKEVSQANKGKLNNIIDRVDRLTEGFDEAMGGDPEAEFSEAWQRVQGSLTSLDSSMGNIEDATSKIASGEGTIGKLIYDDTTVNKVNDTLDGLNSLLGNAKVFRISLDFHSEYRTNIDVPDKNIKTYAGVRIQPGLDRFYELGIVQDPFGVVEEKTTETTVGGVTTVVDEKETKKGKIKINAMFGKNFYDFSLKGGLIEGAGGFAIGYHMFRNQLSINAEAFDFEEGRLRFFIKATPYKGLYVIGGRESNDQYWTPFFGGGLLLTNDDLKLLATQVFR